MTMSLTSGDLRAINRLITSSEKRMIQRINELDDTLSIQMAAGLEELHDKFNSLSDKLDKTNDAVGRIERRQQAEIDRVDRQGNELTRLKRKVGVV